MKKFLMIATMFVCSLVAFAQDDLARPYNEDIDAMAQIDEAVAKAKVEGKNVMCQVGGNWCVWCRRFAQLVTKDANLAKEVADHYVYIHVNYSPKNKNEKAMKRFGNPGLGYPFFVVMDGEGKVLHVQESSVLEEDNGYNKDKIMKFFKEWEVKK